MYISTNTKLSERLFYKYSSEPAVVVNQNNENSKVQYKYGLLMIGDLILTWGSLWKNHDWSHNV